MAQQTMEERVAHLEGEVSRLRWELAHQKGAVSGRTAPDFLEKFAGIFANDPTFDEITAEIKAKRERQRIEAENAPHSGTGEKIGWRGFVGVYADSPEFEEVVRIGQEWRNADRSQTEE